MDYISFVYASSKLQEDTDLLSFASAIKKIENIPLSSDPRTLGRYLYRKLNHQQTLGFQKWFMIYLSSEPNNEVPKELINQAAFLNAINIITDLQNSDPQYKDF